MSYFPRTSAQLNISELKSTPRSDIAALAAADFVKGKPGIVESTRITHSLAYYEQAFARMVAKHTTEWYMLAKEFQESGAWKEHYKTWAETCEHVLNVSSSVYYKKVSQISDNGKVAKVPLFDKDVELECLKAIGEARSKWQAEQSKPEQDTQTAAPEAAKEASQSAPETTPESTPEPAKEASKPPIDVSGCVIPQRLLENDLRERHGEVTGAAHWASKLKTLFEGIQNDHDPLFVNLKASGNIQTFMNGAASMHRAISECLPEVVCPQCSARTKTCHLCHGSGWISEVRWNRDWVKAADSVKQTEVRRRAAIKAEYV